MPIRFRCAYCNQLMGISTRKAGSVVRCPKCAGEIIVPMPEGMQAPDQAEEPLAFEEAAVEQLLNEPAPGKKSPHEAPTETAPATPEAEPSPLPPPIAAPKRLGLFIPLGMLIVSLVIIVLLLISMFVLGLIIGRHTVIAETKTAKGAITPAGVRSFPAGSGSPSATLDPERSSFPA